MSIVVHYFDSWGRAERIRWILLVNNLQYTDKFYEWEEWLAVRPTVEFGQLPIVEIDGHRLIQSLSIERYLGRKLGYIASDSYQEYLIDSTVGCIDDYFRHFAEFLIYTNNLTGYVEYYTTELKANLGFIEARLESNGDNGFLVGNSLTLADFAVSNFVYDIFLSGPRKSVLTPLITEGNPKLVEFTQNFVKKLPALAAHLSVRQDKEF